MSTKAQNMGCESETGMCEHYIPGDGKVINGVMRWAGFKDGPIPGGRCMKADKMISRMDACPVSGKLAKKQTKAEQFGCATCEHAKKYTVLCCELAGKYASISNLHECPKTKPQSLTEEELAQKRVTEYGCEVCKHFLPETESEKAICLRIFRYISLVAECPGCVEKTQKTQELERVLAQEMPHEESAPPTTSTPPMKILALDVSTKCTGWAIREGDKVVEHGSIKATGDDTEKRKEVMRQGVINYCLNQAMNCVLIERSFIKNNDPSRVICEMQGIIKSLVFRVGFKLLEVSPTTWRAICPGSGRCDKDASIEYARLKGYVFESADEAEAICMALSFGPQLVEILNKSKVKEKKNGKSKETGSGGNGRKRSASDNGGLSGRIPCSAAPTAQ